MIDEIIELTFYSILIHEGFNYYIRIAKDNRERGQSIVERNLMSILIIIMILLSTAHITSLINESFIKLKEDIFKNNIPTDPLMGIYIPMDVPP